MKQRQIIGLIFILILITTTIWVLLPNNSGIHLGSIHHDIKVVRGLDLQGGLRVILQADLPDDVEVSGENMNTARNIIENRVDGLGIANPLVQILGSRQILVELPSIIDPEQVVATIKETGLLEFIEIDTSDFIYLQEDKPLLTDFGEIGPIPAQETVTPLSPDTPDPEPADG